MFISQVLINMMMDGQTQATNLLDALSVLARTQQVSRSFQLVLSRLKLLRSSTTVDKLITELVKKGGLRWEKYLETVVDKEGTAMLVMMDNWNPSQWLRFLVEKYRRITSLNTICKQLPIPFNLDMTKYFLREFQYMKMRMLFLNLGKDFRCTLLHGFDLSINQNVPGLKDFAIHPLIEDTSSREEHNLDHKVKVLEGEMKVEERVAINVEDPEPGRLTFKFIDQLPKKRVEWRYLIPMIGLFHLRNHLVKGVLLDPQIWALLTSAVIPHYEKKAKDDVKNMIDLMFKKMKKLSVKEEKTKLKWIKLKLRGTTDMDDAEENAGISSSFWPNDDDLEDPPDELMAHLMQIHLCKMVTTHQKTNGLTGDQRKPFKFANDPKKGIRILRDLWNIGKELKDDGILPAVGDGHGGDEENPGLVALQQIMELIDMIVTSFDDLFTSFNATTLFQNLPKMLSKLGCDNHPFLLSAYLPFVSQLIHWKETNPNIIRFIAHNLHSLHDSFIENMNSLGSRTMANAGNLSQEEAYKVFEMISIKWDIQQQLGTSTSSTPELIKEYQQDSKSDLKLLVKRSIIHTIDRVKTLKPYLRGVGPILPDWYEIGVKVVMKNIDERNAPIYSPKSQEYKIIKRLTPYSTSSVKKLWEAAVEQLGNHPYYSREEEEEEVKIENENHRLIQKPSPPLKIDVVRADIAQIFINSGRWEEVRHGFVRLVRELGVKLLPDKKRSREQLNDSEIDTSSPDESSDFEPIKKQRI